MKTLKITIEILFILLLTICFASSLTLVSCSNNDDDPQTTIPLPVADYFLKAKVNGVQYTATSTQTNATKIGSGATTTITINSSVAGKNFKFTLIGTPATGTFPLNENSSNGDLSYMESSLNYSTLICPDNSGTLIITAVSNTEIAGTFNFVAKSSTICSDAAKTITEGSFKIKFII
jgi:Family of unknown function (DUF6252)